MTDLEARVVRLESMLLSLRQELRDTRVAAERALQATAARGAGGGGFGSSIVLARAVGAIGARSGTTLGSGTIHLLSDDDPLTEGAVSVAVSNLLDASIADDAWLAVADLGTRKLVIGAGSCGNIG